MTVILFYANIKTYNVTCVETDDKICPENTSPIEIGDRNDAIKSGLNHIIVTVVCVIFVKKSCKD